MSNRWSEIKEVFQEAHELPEVERARFLDRRCGEDAALRSEVDSLLAAAADSSRDLELWPDLGPAVETVTTARQRPPDALADTRIGPYRLLREIGGGGMGKVYLARRDDDQFRKRVALKLLRAGLETVDLVRRFRQERQILASLEHPNIAALLDGGTSPDGRPYLVMEYVDGLAIDQYCDAQRLSIKERLILFREVCSAVQFAHRNLIVHRDIKPGNVLVTSTGVPKLLDFGIAKLLNPELSGESMDPTRIGERLMTPEYASPEQVRGEPITTASDVYSLGVLLYHLLTGHRPYVVAGLSLHEITHAVCETEPPKPSTVIDRVDDVPSGKRSTERITPAEVSATREGTPERLRRRLRGDLDTIVLMALRKEPHRRYASVEQLSEDIRRELAGLPVLARKDTFVYRGRKFLRRHTAGVAAAAFVFAVLVAGIVVTTRQARIAERRFNEVRQLANSFLFEFHDAIENLPGSTPARELLVKTALVYLDRLAQESGGDLSLQNELARAYLKVGDVQGNPNTSNLGDLSGALDSYGKALAILESVNRIDSGALSPTRRGWGPDAAREDLRARRNLSAGYKRMADVVEKKGDTARAVELVRKSLAVLEAAAAAFPAEAQLRSDLSGTQTQLGSLLANTGDLTGALSAQRNSLRIREEVAALDPNDASARRSVTLSLDAIGDVLKRASDTAGALASYRKALEIRGELTALAPHHTGYRRDVAISHANIGDVLSASGENAAALESTRSALAIFEELATVDPKNARAQRDLGLTHKKVGDLLSYLGKPTEAKASYEQALRIRQALVGSDPENADSRRDLMVTWNDLGDVLGNPDFVNLGDAAGALASYRKGLSVAEALAAADTKSVVAQRDLWVSLSKVGQMLEVTGALQQALASYQRGLPIAEALATSDPSDTRAQRDVSISHELLGILSLRRGDVEGALRHHRDALALREALAEKDPSNAVARSDVAMSSSGLAAAYLGKARAPSVSAADRAQASRAACTAYERAVTLWRDMESRGTLEAAVLLELRTAERAYARCRTSAP